MIPADLDVARHETVDTRIGAAEQDVLSRALEIVVDDLHRSRTVEGTDCLRIHCETLAADDVAVQHFDVAPVQPHATLLALRGMTVYEKPIQHDVRWNRGPGRLPGVIGADLEKGVVTLLRNTVNVQEFDAVVTGTRIDRDDGRRLPLTAPTDQPRQR